MAVLRKQQKKNKYVKYIYILLAIIALLFISSSLMINGKFIKSPLEEYLNKQLSGKISFSDIDYSLIYPNIIKIDNATYNKESLFKQAYIEFSLYDLLFDNKLNINYLYTEQLDLKNHLDLKKLKNSYNSIYIKSADLKNSQNLTIFDLNAKNTSLHLNKLSYNQDGFKINDGSLQLSDVSLHELHFDDISFNFIKQKNAYALNNMNLRVLGGTVQTQGIFNSTNNKLTLLNLKLNNLVINDFNKIKALNIDVISPIVNLNNVTLELNQYSMIANGISGTLYNFKYTPDDFSFHINAQCDSLLLDNNPDWTISNATFTGDLINQNLIASIDNASLFDGKMLSKLSYNFKDNNLTINDFYLADGKLELKDDSYDLFEHFIYNHSLRIEDINLVNCSFLSYIDKYPISIKSFSFKTQGQNSFYPNGYSLNSIYSFMGQSLLYKDQFVKSLHLQASIFEDNKAFNLLELCTNSSCMQGNLILNKDLSSSLSLKSDKLNLGDLNSNLIGSHTIAGNLSFDVNINSKGQSYEDFVKNASGSIHLKADEILISNLGIDLLNTNDKLQSPMTIDELLDYLSASDVGLYKLDLKADVINNAIKASFKNDLTTASMDNEIFINLIDKSYSILSTIKALDESKQVIVDINSKDNKVLITKKLLP